MMKARLALVLAASLGVAACQADDPTTPTSAPSMSASPAAGQQDLLTIVPPPALDGVQQGRLAAIRGRASSAEVHLARIAGAPGQMLRAGAVVRLGVAPGVQVVATGERVNQRAADDISWGGPIQGTYGWVQAVLMNGELTATVTVGTTQYAIESIGNGLHAVTRIDQNGFPPEHTADNPSGVLSTAMSSGVGSIRGAKAPQIGISALTTINVMVVYTASAASAAGNIASKIQLAVDETNQSYVNSGINITFNKVYAGQVTYSEAGRSFSQHVSALQSTSDGVMDNVHTLRNTYAADLVMLVVNDTEACGQAAAIKATATSAFATADQSCITGYYSFGHEFGHLQGARHDRFVDGSTSPYAYGHGFIPSTKTWRTIMAYGNNCGNCQRIKWWSNPLKTYPATGQVMGTTAYEDNARVLNLTAPTVALFR